MESRKEGGDAVRPGGGSPALFRHAYPVERVKYSRKFIRSDILEALLSEPDKARHDLDIIDRVIRTVHKWYMDHIPKENLQPSRRSAER
ncbi:MAG: hypothetical protein PHZ09_14310 [Eubacteriales bacterium]|nr:hypothetical protein [Eubacteriales bacterium]